MVDILRNYSRRVDNYGYKKHKFTHMHLMLIKEQCMRCQTVRPTYMYYMYGRTIDSYIQELMNRQDFTFSAH